MIAGIQDIEMGEVPLNVKTTSSLQILKDQTRSEGDPFDNLCFLLFSPEIVPVTPKRSRESMPLGRQAASSIWDAIERFQSTEFDKA